jgi:hypothetical protein
MQSFPPPSFLPLTHDKVWPQGTLDPQEWAYATCVATPDNVPSYYWLRYHQDDHLSNCDLWDRASMCYLSGLSSQVLIFFVDFMADKGTIWFPTQHTTDKTFVRYQDILAQGTPPLSPQNFEYTGAPKWPVPNTFDLSPSAAQLTLAASTLPVLEAPNAAAAPSLHT